MIPAQGAPEPHPREHRGTRLSPRKPRSFSTFIVFHHTRHPAEMGEAEVTAFLSHLAQTRRVSASTQNQAFCAVLFLYRHVLGRRLGQLEGLVWAKRSEHVPVVLTRDEVVEVLAHLSGPSWLASRCYMGRACD